MKFNEKKTTDLARFFIRESANHRIEHVKLLKLLYLSDREYLDRYNTVITRDRYVSMKLGPVLSNTFSLINGYRTGGKGQPEGDKGSWYYYIDRELPYHLKLFPENSQDPYEFISPQEENIAQIIQEKYGNIDTFKLVDIVHNTCSEWTDPSISGRSVVDLSLEEILIALGRTSEERNEILTNMAFDF